MVDRLEKFGYIPLDEVERKHPEIAKWLKHVRRPDLYVKVKRTVYSTPPVRGAQVIGVFVVSVDAMRRVLGREGRDDLIKQDFFVHYPRGERPPVLYSGRKGSRALRTFCKLYAGPRGDGYGCGTDGLPRDHHYADAASVGVREGRFRAALNEALRVAKNRAREGRR